MTPSDTHGHESALTAEITELCREEAPRLFTVAEIDVDNDDGWILGWGLSWPDRVILTGADGTGFARFRTLESAMRLFGPCRATRVVWHDADDGGSAATASRDSGEGKADPSAANPPGPAAPPAGGVPEPRGSGRGPGSPWGACRPARTGGSPR
ncbi:hypothetical protein EKD16_17425 [Streptomonospora litoralis]|uniref:Uncharacterized protein n=1 Tax=Streptomonospora litoralis TaxID=2498135 RepID=A0A4P6Q3W5_9ACTN|nr:hypothetical protein EKD16_17425 [Streptomonospora litoralis]